MVSKRLLNIYNILSSNVRFGANMSKDSQEKCYKKICELVNASGERFDSIPQEIDDSEKLKMLQNKRFICKKTIK